MLTSEIHPDLVAILDTRAGRTHSATGPVMTCLGEILARHLELLAAAGLLLPARPVIVVDPAVRWAQPSIRGVPTDAVAGAVRAGEDFTAVAAQYGLSLHEVILACWYEGSVTYRSEWRSWVLAVAPKLGGWEPFDPEAIEEPPNREATG